MGVGARDAMDVAAKLERTIEGRRNDGAARNAGTRMEYDGGVYTGSRGFPAKAGTALHGAGRSVNFGGRTGSGRRGMGPHDPTVLVERKSVQLNVFETANAGFAQAMYEEYLRDPASVAPEWRRLFDSGVVGERPASVNGAGNGTAPAPTTASASATAAVPAGAAEIKGPAARLVQNMNESLRIPTATTFREINVTTLDARRRELNAALAASGKPGKVSFTHLVAWALVQGLKRHPMMGHALQEQGGTAYRVIPDGINLGLAVDVQRKDGSRG